MEELNEDVPGFPGPNGKDIGGRVERLEKRLDELEGVVVSHWKILQDLLGIRFVQTDTGQLALMIAIPKKDEGKPGLLSEMYTRIDKLWKQYGDSGVIMPDLGKPLR
mgnify:CR=1 FL=1|jgi:hypothetical protein|tara:strand:+ start:2761 stop:3081 length:321 start_codon:yes stop_codon:yes gene_type:complete